MVMVMMVVCVSLVSTEGSDHPLQAQTLRLSCHLRRWSGKEFIYLPFSPPIRLHLLFVTLRIHMLYDKGFVSRWKLALL